MQSYQRYSKAAMPLQSTLPDSMWRTRCHCRYHSQMVSLDQSRDLVIKWSNYEFARRDLAGR